MPPWQIYLTDRIIYLEPYDLEIEAFAKLGCEFILDDCKTDDELIHRAKNADIILSTHYPIRRQVIESLPNLKLVVRYMVGYDEIDINAATECGVIVSNTPNYCTAEVADHALTLMLALMRNLRIFDKGVRDTSWGDWGPITSKYPVRKFDSSILGIIGLGRIGRNLAKKCLSLGLRVIAHDPYVPQEIGLSLGVPLIDRETVISEADIVSLHTPLTAETYHMVDERFLSQMKPTAYLINTSRGKVVDQTALLRALQEDTIAGAGLDVFEKEPLEPNHPLLQCDKVILTPHHAFYSNVCKATQRQEAIAAVAALCRGEWPVSVVNTQVKPKISLH